MSRGMGSRSMGMSRSVQSNHGVTARSFQGNRGMSARSHRANRNFASNRGVNTRSLARSNVNTARVNRQAAVDGRHHHHHRRHHRGGRWYPGYAFYGDYAGYDTCYRYAWTARGYRYVNTCAPDYYYGAY